MLTLSLTTALLLFSTSPVQAGNPACAALTTAEVTSLVGAGAHMLPVSAEGNGGSCMYQSGDKMVVILYVKRLTMEGIAPLWSSKKLQATGKDLKGLATRAYEGAQGAVPIIGLVKDGAFLEVKVVDPTKKLPVLAPKLRAVMKTVSSRM